MSKTYTIHSTLPMGLHIAASPDNPEKPGEAGPLDQAVIYPGRNKNIDAKLYDSWAETYKYHPAVAGGHFKIVDDEDEEPGASYGYEPGLEALAKDKDNAKAAKEGSTVDAPAPFGATDPRELAAAEAPTPMPGSASTATAKTRSPK